MSFQDYPGPVPSPGFHSQVVLRCEMNQQAEVAAKPFLKWAGGKSQLIAEIGARFPYQPQEEFTYVEPFVGGGAVLFWVLNNYPGVKKAVINDLNSDLTGTYRAIRNTVKRLIEELHCIEDEYHRLDEDHGKKRAYYNARREDFNRRDRNQTSQAALMIFLNKTGFNGLYRVNRNNGFNVPLGSYRKPLICDRENLLAASKVLKKVTILNEDFEGTLPPAGTGGNTFFYFDPPYKPLSSTANFNTYAKDGFDDAEQNRLKEFCDLLHEKKHRWALSNSDVKSADPDNNFFDDLYIDYSDGIDRVWAKRSINSNPSKRGKLTELLITNYAYNRPGSPLIHG